MSNFISLDNTDNADTQKNLDRFISLAKNELTVFGKDLTFDDNVWNLSKFIEEKSSKKRIVALFSTYDYASKNTSGKKATNQNIVAMKEPFLSFAKSYFRYRFGIKIFKSPGSIIEPLRILEKALIEVTGDANPNKIDNNVLDKAATLTKAFYLQGRAYRIGGSLAKIGNFLSEKHLTKISIDWRNPIKRPSDTARIGKEFDDNRNKKMPSTIGLEVLPEIFIKATSPYEKLATSLIALLICAPNRINEVFLLQYDCEVIQKDKDGDEQYGLRWFPAKGAAPMIKWIIPSMVDVAKEAIKRIKETTRQAREVAKWYEEHPDKLYLSKNLKYLRDTKLGTTEVAYIIYGKDITDENLKQRKQLAIAWMKQHSVSYEKVVSELTISFECLEKVLLSFLPDRYPYLNKEIGLKLSDALVLQMINEYHSEKGTIIPTISSISMSIVTDALKNRGSMSSLFKRFGYKENDGSQIKITSHQFRHYLNTLAQKGGLSQLDIAKWSGRIDIHQNKAYDHVSANEMLEMVRDAIGDENAIEGPLSNIEDIKKKVVITRDEFARLLVRTAHPTEFGVCFHDYSMLPCQLHRDCMSCTEHVCMKGDTERTDRIKLLKQDTETLLIKAKKAEAEDYFGANRWVEHHTMSLEILNHTCTILDNPDIPNGSFIQLANISTTSPIELAERRRDENLKDDTTNSIEFDETRNLIKNMGDY